MDRSAGGVGEDGAASGSGGGSDPSRAIRRARARRLGGNAPSALKTIDEFLAAYPDNPEALFERSRVLLQLGDRPESLASMLKGLQLIDASTEAVAIANMLTEENLHQEAEMLLKAKLDDDDEQHTTLFTLAKLLLLRSRFLEADKVIADLTTISPAPAPFVLRVDYLVALKHALLGDEASLRRQVEELRTRPEASSQRLEFFEDLLAFLTGGASDEFAASMERHRRESRRNYLYESFYRDMQPDVFLGVENRSRNEFRRVLGDRWKEPRLSGAAFSEVERPVVLELFHRARAVSFREINDEFGKLTAGKSGDRVLQAESEMKGYSENPCLLKIGAKYRIAIEREKMQTYVFNILHPGYHPQILGYASGRSIAGMTLSWGPSADDDLYALRHLYVEPSKNAILLDKAFEKLFTVVMKGWYARNMKFRKAGVFRNLGRYAGELERIVDVPGAAGCENDDPASLLLESMGTRIVHPVQALRQIAAEKGSEKIPIPWGLHHGDLNSRNVILDGHGHMCLIDFYKSEPGFVLLDAARLEVDLRYEASRFDPAYLPEFRWIDAHLAGSVNSELLNLDIRRSMEKRLRVAHKLRTLMAEIFPEMKQNFLPAYRTALVISLVKLLGYGHLSSSARDLALAEISDLASALAS